MNPGTVDDARMADADAERYLARLEARQRRTFKLEHL